MPAGVNNYFARSLLGQRFFEYPIMEVGCRMGGRRLGKRAGGKKGVGVGVSSRSAKVWNQRFFEHHVVGVGRGRWWWGYSAGRQRCRVASSLGGAFRRFIVRGVGLTGPKAEGGNGRAAKWYRMSAQPAGAARFLGYPPSWGWEGDGGATGEKSRGIKGGRVGPVVVVPRSLCFLGYPIVEVGRGWWEAGGHGGAK